MITRCPQCGARYRVEEDRLAAAANKVQCSVCETVFEAKADAPAGHPPERPQAEVKTTVISAIPPVPSPQIARPPGPGTPGRPAPAPGQRAEAASALQDALSAMLKSPGLTLSGQRNEAGPPTEPIVVSRGDALSNDVITPQSGAPAVAAPPKPPISPAAAGPSGPKVELAELEVEALDARLKAAQSRTTGGHEAVRWKVRSKVGLIYDFPDIEALKAWLSARDSAEGMDGSADGGKNWKPLESIPELESAHPKAGRARRRAAGVGDERRAPGTAPAAPAPAALAAPPARPEPSPPVAAPPRQAVTTPAPAADEPFRPYYLTRRRAGLGTKIGLVASFMIMAVAALQISGMVDIVGLLGLHGQPGTEDPYAVTAGPGLLPEGPTGVTPSGAPPPSTAAQGPPSTAQLTEALPPVDPMDDWRTRNPHRGRIELLTAEARDAAAEGHFEEAISLVNGAVQLDRRDPELYCLLADLYRQSGSLTQADSLQGQCEALQAGRSDEPTELP